MKNLTDILTFLVLGVDTSEGAYPFPLGLFPSARSAEDYIRVLAGFDEDGGIASIRTYAYREIIEGVEGPVLEYVGGGFRPGALAEPGPAALSLAALLPEDGRRGLEAFLGLPEVSVETDAEDLLVNLRPGEAYEILSDLVDRFPGLADHFSSVNGADLTEHLTRALSAISER